MSEEYKGSFVARDAAGNEYQLDVFVQYRLVRSQQTTRKAAVAVDVRWERRTIASETRLENGVTEFELNAPNGTTFTVTSDDPRHLGLLDIRPNG